MKIITVLLAFFCLTACSEKLEQLEQLDDNAVILAFGDSLTYGTGANKSNSYPMVLQQLTDRIVINAGIPGERSKEGLERLAEALEEHAPDLVFLCHGGNDLIQRLDKAALQHNLEQMITAIQQTGAQVILIAVPDFTFTRRVPELYQTIATKFQIPVETNLLATIEGDPSLKSDTVHPNAAGYQKLAQGLYNFMQTVGAL